MTAQHQDSPQNVHVRLYILPSLRSFLCTFPIGTFDRADAPRPLSNYNCLPSARVLGPIGSHTCEMSHGCAAGAVNELSAPCARMKKTRWRLLRLRTCSGQVRLRDPPSYASMHRLHLAPLAVDLDVTRDADRSGTHVQWRRLSLMRLEIRLLHAVQWPAPLPHPFHTSSLAKGYIFNMANFCELSQNPALILPSCDVWRVIAVIFFYPDPSALACHHRQRAFLQPHFFGSQTPTP